MPGPVTPIGRDEILMRRVPNKDDRFNPAISAKPTALAFRPIDHDTTGLSVSRRKSPEHQSFLDEEQFALGGGSKSGYFVALLRYADLVEAGISVVHVPTDDDPGHAEIPSLTYEERKSDASIETTHTLAHLTFDVPGPFKRA